MDWRAALIGVVAAAGVAAAAKPKRSAGGPKAVHLRAVDLTRRIMLIEVEGLSRPPPSNFFTMTDERGRHYIAQSIRCDPPFPSGARLCELEIPLGYERHPLTTMQVHLRGLHGRTITVPRDEVRAAWAAAAQAVTPSTSAPPDVPDGGAPPDLMP